mgnify:CR=1 FL=1
MNEYSISELVKEDYYCGFLQLLEQLTVVNANDIKYDDFVDRLNQTSQKIFVIKDNNQIIGTASVFIEHKFIHKLSNVGHIEDVVVNLEYRKQGIGKLLVDHCVEYAKEKQCYKIILNCASHNISFYEKCGFKSKNVEMSLYTEL